MSNGLHLYTTSISEHFPAGVLFVLLGAFNFTPSTKAGRSGSEARSAELRDAPEGLRNAIEGLGTVASLPEAARKTRALLGIEPQDSMLFT